MLSFLYFSGAEGEQKLFFLAGSQNACGGADMENMVCGQVEVDEGGLWGIPWKQRPQVGLHDLPVEGQL